MSLFSNVYEVDGALVGRRIELLYDPFDLTRIEVRHAGRDLGLAVPHRVGAHVHPAARAEAPAPAPPTGIDYLGLLADDQEAELRRQISYRDLQVDDDPTAAATETTP